MPEQKFKQELLDLHSKIEASAEALEKSYIADNAEIKVEVKNVVDAVNQLEKTLNGRIKKLELSEARREGVESVGFDKNRNVNWTKIILAILGITAGAITLATILAQSAVKGG